MLLLLLAGQGSEFYHVGAIPVLLQGDNQGFSELGSGKDGEK
jgi:hypothetical protein